MKVLITGANGLLGQKLLTLFLDNGGFSVITTSRGIARFPIEKLNVKYYDLDITRRDHVFNIIHMEKPDVIIHTAAMTNVDFCETHQEDCWEVNVRSVVHLLHAAESYNSFFIHLSTDFVFSGEKRYLTEKDTPKPVNFYGQSKLQAEMFVLQSRVAHAILRTALVYGVVQNMSRSNIVLWVKNSLENNQPIRVVDDQYRTPTLAEDLAMGCYLVATQKASGIFNISGGELLSPYEMALQVASVFGLDESLISRTDSTEFSQPAKRPLETGLIIDKAKSELGYNPRTFQEGLSLVSQQLTINSK